MNRTKHSLFLSLVAIAALGLTACGGGGDKDGGEKADPEVVKAANEKWDTLCVTCHGATGKGDGPGAAALNPKPRSFADPAWQSSVTDEHIEKVIVEGGAAVGKSALMTANPDLKDKPEVVKELVKAIRAFGPKADAK